jgi:hypothetical protein
MESDHRRNLSASQLHYATSDQLHHDHKTDHQVHGHVLPAFSVYWNQLLGINFPYEGYALSPSTSQAIYQISSFIIYMGLGNLKLHFYILF